MPTIQEIENALAGGKILTHPDILVRERRLTGEDDDFSYNNQFVFFEIFERKNTTEEGDLVPSFKLSLRRHILNYGPIIEPTDISVSSTEDGWLGVIHPRPGKNF